MGDAGEPDWREGDLRLLPTPICGRPHAADEPAAYASRMYWDHMDGYGWGMMVAWSVIWVALLALIAWAIVTWARGGQTRPRPSSVTPAPRAARDVLDHRLAGGEIDIDEYQRRRAAVEASTPPSSDQS